MKGTPALKRCAIYARTAPACAGAPTPTSLEAQRDACVRYVRKQAGWRVVAHRYEDGGKSGANVDRPALQRLLADIDAGRVDVVVVHQTDRLTRWFPDFVAMMERFGLAGAEFVSVGEDVSTAQPRGRSMISLVMSFAELERAVRGDWRPELARRPREVR